MPAVSFWLPGDDVPDGSLPSATVAWGQLPLRAGAGTRGLAVAQPHLFVGMAFSSLPGMSRPLVPDLLLLVHSAGERHSLDPLASAPDLNGEYSIHYFRDLGPVIPHWWMPSLQASELIWVRPVVCFFRTNCFHWSFF